MIALTALHATTAAAQSYPTKSIRIIAPFPPASVADVLARPIAQKMAETWGQPVIVDNRTGAAGNVGADWVAKSPPDGYTLLLGTIGTNAINAALYSKMPYNVRTDFAPITVVANAYLLLVMHPSVPVRTVKEVIALARAQPDKLNFGSAGAGTTPHLAGEMFKYLTGVSMTHVAYKGSPQSAIDLMAGRLDLIFANGSAALPHIRTGRMRLIAISAPKRDPAMPDVPTIAETVPGFEMSPWWGLFAPAGTPRDGVARLHGEASRILALQEIKAHYANLGLNAVSNTPEQFNAYVQDEIARWAKIVKATGARAD
ncbi:MAG TPA: tripartite tricarboxylate transporter substrate binding protein [Burkholderiales bacterium]|nr:tripartite tricarboxylate transporter substrate binding protein [Burkholderiales bacterium]